LQQASCEQTEFFFSFCVKNLEFHIESDKMDTWLSWENIDAKNTKPKISTTPYAA